MENKKVLITDTFDPDEIRIRIENISKAFCDLAKAVTPVIVNAVNTVAKALKSCFNAYALEQKYVKMKYSIEFIEGSRQKPKLRHIALNSKKRRIRRKNIKRLYKLGQKYYYKAKYPNADVTE